MRLRELIHAARHLKCTCCDKFFVPGKVCLNLEQLDGSSYDTLACFHSVNECVLYTGMFFSSIVTELTDECTAFTRPTLA